MLYCGPRYTLLPVYQHLFAADKQSSFDSAYLQGCQTLFDQEVLWKDENKATSPRLGQMINIQALLSSRKQ